MASRVLGNDPFKRGTAERADVPAHDPKPAPVAKKAKRRAQSTPELQVPRGPAAKAKGPEASAPAPAVGEVAQSAKRRGGRIEAPPGALPSTTPAEAVTPAPEATPDSAPRGAATRAAQPATRPLPPGAPEVPTARPSPLSPDAVFAAPPPPAGVAAPRASHPVIPPRSRPVAAPPPPAPPPAPSSLAPRPTGLRASLRGLTSALKTAAGLSPRDAQLDRWGKDAHLTQALGPLAAALYERYWRVKVDGASQLPSGPCILVANHAGALPLDGPVVHLALKRERPDLAESRWLLEDQVFHAPFVGVLANRLGAVRASPDNAYRLLDEGRPVIVFPEGFHGLSKPFSERYQLKRFGRGGSVKIAARAGVPLVPVAIVGGEEAMPLLGKLPGDLLGVEYLPLTLPPLPSRWHVRFGEPIRLHDIPRDLDADLAWVQRENERLRDTIRTMLTAMLASRRGVFSGS